MHLTANLKAEGRLLDLHPTVSPVSFYLPSQAGNLFAMYYPPTEGAGEGYDLLHVHPFAGEMAASRNVIAAVSRHLASAGVGVLTLTCSAAAIAAEISAMRAGKFGATI